MTKPFVQEAELKEKSDCLPSLNALLNMDENGNNAQIDNETPEHLETDTVEYSDQRAEQSEAGILKYDNQRQERRQKMQGVIMQQETEVHTN